MAEIDGIGIAAVFTADTDEEIGFYGSCAVDGNFHEFADAFFIQGDEGADGQNFLFHIGVEEFAFGIVTGETEGGLGEVVGTEGEEFRFGSQVSAARGTSTMVPTV